MKIKRSINGVEYEFELTKDELFNAYCEQEYEYDKADIEDVIECLDDEEVIDTYDVTRAEFESLIPRMAYEKRRQQDKYGVSWDYARDEAIGEIINQFQNDQLTTCKGI